MRQLHIVDSIATDFGGLGVAALRYAQSISLTGAEVSLYVIDRSKPEIHVDPAHGCVKVVGGGSGSLGKAIVLKKFLDEHIFDVVHIHGTWSPILTFASFLVLFRKIPLVVSPHGSLEPWAIRNRRWKKVIALALYQRPILAKASMLVATASKELESIRRLRVLTPVAVLPNGVDIPSARRSLLKERKILFLSRIHPVKGLSDLIDAWVRVRQPGWKVIIAGGGGGDHLLELRAKIESFRLTDDFIFLGLVTGDQKELIFSQADFFILPTYSENFGIAVAEALAHGVPVITTTGAPWSDIEMWQCGWWVQPGVVGISAALTQAMNTPRDRLIEMGRRGTLLVKEKYSWEKIGREAIQAYSWVLGCDNAPRFIDFVSGD